MRTVQIRGGGMPKNNTVTALAGQGRSGKVGEGIFESLIFLERKVKSGPTDLVSNTLLLYESF